MPIIGVVDSGKSGHLTPPTTFVAVAYNSSASATSSDGVTWTARTMPSVRNWYAMAYGGGRFVIQGNGSTVGAYSTDGITWTTTALPQSSFWVQTGYGNSRFVTQGQNAPAQFAVSTDNGATWSGNSPGSWAPSSAAFGNGVFVAAETQANAGQNAWYSSNGTSWTNGGSLGATTGWGRGFYNASGGGFLICNNVSANYISQSSSGTGGWSLRTLPASQGWGSCLAYGNGVWSYMGGSGTQGASSTDGVNWTSRTNPASIAWTSMIYSTNYNLFVAVAAASSVAYTSSTGTGSWTSRSLTNSADWYSISVSG
jgi:hypothetical protein